MELKFHYTKPVNHPALIHTVQIRNYETKYNWSDLNKHTQTTYTCTNTFKIGNIQLSYWWTFICLFISAVSICLMSFLVSLNPLSLSPASQVENWGTQKTCNVTYPGHSCQRLFGKYTSQPSYLPSLPSCSSSHRMQLPEWQDWLLNIGTHSHLWTSHPVAHEKAPQCWRILYVWVASTPANLVWRMMLSKLSEPG